MMLYTLIFCSKTFCFWKPKLNHRSCQKNGDNCSDTNCTAKDKSEAYKESITSHSYPAKFNPFEFVGEDDGNQVIRSGAGIAVDYNRHSQRENRTSDQNADDTNRHS